VVLYFQVFQIGERDATPTACSVNGESSFPLAFQAHEVSLEAKILKAIFERDWQKVQRTGENEASNVTMPRRNEVSLETKRLKANVKHNAQLMQPTAERETAKGSTILRLQPCVIPADEIDMKE